MRVSYLFLLRWNSNYVFICYQHYVCASKRAAIGSKNSLNNFKELVISKRNLLFTSDWSQTPYPGWLRHEYSQVLRKEHKYLFPIVHTCTLGSARCCQHLTSGTCSWMKTFALLTKTVGIVVHVSWLGRCCWVQWWRWLVEEQTIGPIIPVPPIAALCEASLCWAGLWNALQVESVLYVSNFQVSRGQDLVCQSCSLSSLMYHSATVNSSISRAHYENMVRKRNFLCSIWFVICSMIISLFTSHFLIVISIRSSMNPN